MKKAQSNHQLEIHQQQDALTANDSATTEIFQLDSANIALASTDSALKLLGQQPSTLVVMATPNSNSRYFWIDSGLFTEIRFVPNKHYMLSADCDSLYLCELPDYEKRLIFVFGK